MAEYFRTPQVHFCDAEMCCVMDKLTGEIERPFHGGFALGPVEDALAWIEPKLMPGRYVIVKLQCIAPFSLGTSEEAK